MKKHFSIFILSIAMLLLTSGALLNLNAQVVISTDGAEKNPQPFSLLELESGNKGMRLPQLMTTQRDAMADDDFKASELSWGLQIFNMDTKCVETWNGEKWISLCKSSNCSPPEQPEIEDRGYIACMNDDVTVYRVVNVDSGVTYNWTAPTGWTIMEVESGDTSRIHAVPGTNAQDGKVTVTAVNACGAASVGETQMMEVIDCR